MDDQSLDIVVLWDFDSGFMGFQWDFPFGVIQHGWAIPYENGGFWQGKSSIGGFSSLPWLITGGYPLEKRLT